MTKALETMIKQLSLEPVTTDIYLGESLDILRSGRIFGGQVLGQALMASSLTVVPERDIHSLHAYFIRPGDVNIPIRFEVERVRDGGSFSNRRVAAYQHNRHIFTMDASYHIEEEGFEHYDAMPDDIKGPENFISERQLVEQLADKLPPSVVKRYLVDGSPIEIRLAHPERYLKGGDFPAKTYYWFKADGHIEGTNSLIHKAALAYVSDAYFMFTSLFPHHQSSFDPHAQLASLDHAIWFHRPINMNEWHVYVMESSNAGSARGLTFGRIYNQQGVLVASTAQEGLIRHPVRFGNVK
ncbi:acyl-CoA thioesterase II [Pelistega sp. NLN82]|uniref:Acyl-CoA thioesterase 2 n=1 Tax=Pelistega ratti TaxID=2652177 RepID=A0A6L9Y396_9BURK|nr:acyl-CoA thioesterase II [Pelistega ratti]NEN74849.1 acyl-CoA thioesterase II [Pelistega ratti]